jgi:hypothetical protein
MARARFRIGLLTAAAAFGLTACGTVDDTVYVAPNKMDAWLADKPAGAHHLYASVLTGGERNRVLNQERAGLAAFEAGDYAASLQSLAALHEPVDAFFDGVMVNAEELDLRLNRQGLLQALHNAMNRVADLSRLAG